jgi:hypothetical protein
MFQLAQLAYFNPRYGRYLIYIIGSCETHLFLEDLEVSS